MLHKLIEILSGKDDLERVASQENPAALNAYLRNRRLVIPRRPKHFLDASDFTPEKFREMVRKELEEFESDRFEPWVLEMDNKRRLPAFSSQKKMEVFLKTLSNQMGKMFALGNAEFLIEEITPGLDIDFVDLNLFNEKSWEIGLGSHRAD